MQYDYPNPEHVGIRPDPDLIPERFRAGFRHALRGQPLSDPDHLRRSFREGFRAAKLFLREVRRQRGILQFPVRGRIRCRATGWDH